MENSVVSEVKLLLFTEKRGEIFLYERLSCISCGLQSSLTVLLAKNS